MALSVRAARHIFVEADGSEVPLEEAKLRHGGFPALVIEFTDGRTVRLHHEQHLLTFDPPGVVIGLEDQVYEGFHPDSGHPVTVERATSDPGVVNLVLGYLRALKQGYKPSPVNLETGMVD